MLRKPNSEGGNVPFYYIDSDKENRKTPSTSPTFFKKKPLLNSNLDINFYDEKSLLADLHKIICH